MTIAVFGNALQKEELLSQSIQEELSIIPVTSVEELCNSRADAYFDLLFEKNKARILLLSSIDHAPVFINYPEAVLDNMPEHFIRLNAWPGFLNRSAVEASCSAEPMRLKAETIFSVIGKKICWQKDIPGFVSARVIAMIINEAYFALNEKVSHKKDIDAAMRYGTNYPFGPFEWGQKIGLKNIAGLLQTLSKEQTRYTPSDLLVNEANS